MEKIPISGLFLGPILLTLSELSELPRFLEGLLYGLPQEKIRKIEKKSHFFKKNHIVSHISQMIKVCLVVSCIRLIFINGLQVPTFHDLDCRSYVLPVQEKFLVIMIHEL